MRNAITTTAALVESALTLALLPILLFHRPAWLVARVVRLANGIELVRFRDGSSK